MSETNPHRPEPTGTGEPEGAGGEASRGAVTLHLTKWPPVRRELPPDIDEEGTQEKGCQENWCIQAFPPEKLVGQAKFEEC